MALWESVFELVSRPARRPLGHLQDMPLEPATIRGDLEVGQEIFAVTTHHLEVRPRFSPRSRGHKHLLTRDRRAAQ